MCNYSEEAIDYSAGMDKMPDGTLKARKIGCWVNSLEEAREWAKKKEQERLDAFNLVRGYLGIVVISLGLALGWW